MDDMTRVETTQRRYGDSGSPSGCASAEESVCVVPVCVVEGELGVGSIACPVACSLTVAPGAKVGGAPAACGGLRRAASVSPL